MKKLDEGERRGPSRFLPANIPEISGFPAEIPEIS
jgi:hypothetical protein